MHWVRWSLNDRLPVDVFGGPDGASTNMRSARQAFQLLSKGHCIAMFPAGEVAHWHTGIGSITDPAWNESAARFAMRTGASVVPISYVGFRERGSAIPKLMREIGRARETTFRGGGGNLVRWHKASSRVCRLLSTGSDARRSVDTLSFRCGFFSGVRADC
jgi:hypothetical protein